MTLEKTWNKKGGGGLNIDGTENINQGQMPTGDEVLCAHKAQRKEQFWSLECLTPI